MKNVITLLFFVMIFNSVVFGQAEAPLYPNVVIWEPIYFDGQPSSGDAMVAALQEENNEWTAYYYRDEDEDASVGDCSRENADSLGCESGVTVIQTHCWNSGAYLTLAASTDLDVMDDWDNDDPDLSVAGPQILRSYPMYHVVATPTFCSTNWASDHNNAKSIIWLATCSGTNNFASAVGGKTVFAYYGGENWKSYLNIPKIFENMNGLLNNGNYRTSSSAHSNASNLYDDLRHIGGDSTLAPAPDFRRGYYIVSPVGSGAGESGSGYIMFDTIMDTDADPSLALAWSYSGTVEVTNIAWDTTNKNKITFDYCGEPGYTLYMQATTTYCRAPHNGGTYYSLLNGDRVDGNYDDFNWTFSY